ncbi:signal peptidase I [Methanocalculus chunghsingensis]|uniref:signal peptidase I n=1 Tax=Methanocalculus chunghsingensis TaxID=156457 RepID=UPI001B8B2857|nr:signal peptidase I [Methanocalculus chunghsingensis]
MNRKERVQQVIVIIIAIIVGSALVAGVMMEIKPMIVLSGSMEPVMLTGDVILVAPLDPELIEPGDIISFQIPSAQERVVVTHRVLEIDPENREFVTKGDANNAIDANPFSYDDVVGKAVFLIPLIGYTNEARREVTLFFVILPAIALLLSELRTVNTDPRQLMRQEREKKNRRRSLYTINGQRLLLLGLLVLAPFWIIALPSLAGMAGEYTPAEGMVTIKGQNLIPEVYLLPSSSAEPEYGIIGPGEEVVGIASGSSEPLRIIRAPYILPVFWFLMLADLHPYLPSLFIAVVPGMIIIILLHPIWLREKYPSSKKKRRPKNHGFNT